MRLAMLLFVRAVGVGAAILCIGGLFLFLFCCLVLSADLSPGVTTIEPNLMRYAARIVLALLVTSSFGGVVIACTTDGDPK